MKVCCIDGCENTKILAKGMCNKHYKQMYRHGRIIPRTIKDPNEYCFIPWLNCYEFMLLNIKSETVATFLIDADDLEKVSKYKWYLGKNGYVTHKGENNIYLHRLIAGDKIKDFCDHINGDRLDNRKDNLRNVSKSKNNMNKGMQSNNTSGRVGVYTFGNDKWRAQIEKEGKIISLGVFSDFQKACDAREAAEIKYFGEYQSYLYRNT